MHELEQAFVALLRRTNILENPDISKEYLVSKLKECSKMEDLPIKIKEIKIYLAELAKAKEVPVEMGYTESVLRAAWESLPELH